MGIKKSIRRIQNLLSQEGVNTAEEIKALKKIVEKLDVKGSALREKLEQADDDKERDKLRRKLEKCESRRQKAIGLMEGIDAQD